MASIVLAVLYDDGVTILLAEDYALGRGTPIDDKKAIEFYQQSAKHGNPMAEAILSEYYARGIGVPQNYQLAYMWATIARSSNNQEASNRAVNIMQALTFVMSSDQIQKAQNMAVEWKPLSNANESNDLS